MPIKLVIKFMIVVLELLCSISFRIPDCNEYSREDAKKFINELNKYEKTLKD